MIFYKRKKNYFQNTVLEIWKLLKQKDIQMIRFRLQFLMKKIIRNIYFVEIWFRIYVLKFQEKKEIEEKFPSKKINLYVIRNDFFGERITVAGLLTGVDIINQLKGKELGDRLLLSVNMFRSGEEVLLDDLTRSDIERELETKTVIVGQSGYDLVNAIVSDNYIEENAYKAYEKGVNNE